MRNWPLVIKGLVKDCNDPVIILGLKLHELVERLTAGEFYPYEIDILEDKLTQYLDLRKIVRDDFPNLMTNPKPKHHFLRTGWIHLTKFYLLVHKKLVTIN